MPSYGFIRHQLSAGVATGRVLLIFESALQQQWPPIHSPGVSGRTVGLGKLVAVGFQGSAIDSGINSEMLAPARVGPQRLPVLLYR